MIKFDLLILGNSGWGDELLISSIMTILVSLSSMALGLFIAIFISHQFIDIYSLNILFGLFISNIVFGCGAIKEGLV